MCAIKAKKIDINGDHFIFPSFKRLIINYITVNYITLWFSKSTQWSAYSVGITAISLFVFQ